MPTLQERSDLIVFKIRDELPGNISLQTRLKIAELIRRLIQIEIYRAQGLPDEVGNAAGIEET